MKNFTILVLSALAAIAFAQDEPQEIPKGELPKEAECLMCAAEGHGMEKPAGGFKYKGKAYYFCNSAELKAFKADPDAYIPAVLPRQAPALDLKDEGGKLWDAEALKGKLILVDFWATWCKPWLEMMPAVDKVREKYHSKGFEVLSVSVDAKRADLDKFIKGRGFTNPLLHDTNKVWTKWGVKTIPATFLIKDGQIVAEWKKKVSEKELAAAIEAHLSR